jgi:hypothetical protein
MMIFTKTVFILLAGALAVVAVRRLMGTIEAAKARVQPRRDPRQVTKLRQDPRTGIYYPEA